MKIGFKATPFLIVVACAAVFLFSGCSGENPSGIDQINKINDLFDGNFFESSLYNGADISDWKDYRNEEMGFEIKIPDGWICKKADFGMDSQEIYDKLSGTKSVSCVEKDTADNSKEVARKGQGSFHISYPGVESSKINDIKSHRENILHLKKEGFIYFLLSIDSEDSYLFGEIDSKNDFENSIQIRSEHKGKTLTVVCGQSARLCTNVAKSVADTFKFLD